MRGREQTSEKTRKKVCEALAKSKTACIFALAIEKR
jgi:hypothetical protein